MATFHLISGKGSCLRYLAVLGASTVILLTGCDQPKPVEVVTPRGAGTKEPRQRVKADESPRVESPYSAEVAEPVKTPAEPGYKLLMANEMRLNAGGTTDTQGGVALYSNGNLQIDNYEIPFPVSEVVLEMKGDPAREVWPRVSFNAVNRTTQRNYYPLAETFVTTSSYHLYRLPQNPPLEAGTYLLTFTYYNNQDFPETKEDRSVYLRKVEFRQEPEFKEEP